MKPALKSTAPPRRQRGAAVPRTGLEPDGRYRIADYDRAPAFCSFLPGIGGPDGVPLWCMYVNRAQAVVSFGVHGKDQAIAEFLPATWAYQLVGIQGFRTFCRIDGDYYEPFATDPAGGARPRRALLIAPEALELEEHAAPGGLAFHVEYFATVQQPLGALVRRVRVTNRSRAHRRLHVLDGLPLIIPAGFTDLGLKQFRHIHEAYASVRCVCGHVPFYAGKVVAHDEAEVQPIRHGHFYAAWQCVEDCLQPLEPYVDPHVIFGAGQDLVTPRRFISGAPLDRAAQVWENRLPCALAPLETVLEPGATLQWVALVGFAPDEQLLARFLPCFAAPATIDALRHAGRALLDDICAPAASSSAVPVLDAYVRQNWLDNVLRGGVPRVLPSRDGPTLLHLYARRHGDLERDYNAFELPAHPLSSGTGNYRDVCQNRRSDVWSYPEVGDLEIRQFLQLLQPDGYNPLKVDGYRWVWPPDADPRAHCPSADETARAEWATLLQRPFQPGELLGWTDRFDIRLPDRHAWLNEILGNCTRVLRAHDHEGGYWIDHWTYILDLLEAFADVYPDQVTDMLVGAADIGWFEEGAFVQPRSAKYVRRKSGLLQLQAVADGPVPRPPLPDVTVLGKLCGLLAIKAVTFDPTGRGLEMEAGRPGWNDALNGLPGLFGSSTCEAAELARLAGWLRAALPAPPDTRLPREIADLVTAVLDDLASDYCWERSAQIREDFRARLHARTDAQTRVVAGDDLRRLIEGVERRARAALELSIRPESGLLHTYYVNRPRDGQCDADLPQAFAPEPLPLFLEGQVHWLRVLNDPRRAQAVWHAVRGSPLLDAELGMYKLNECLAACPPEIGRARTFTRGWFENESIWLHMSYKYLLELLRCELFAEFFEDAGTMLVPFMDPQRYGRSVLENSSFIASSANPDPATRGRGFIARLSGSTAEFVHIWRLLTVGPRPFRLADGRLRFAVRPALPGTWFMREPGRIAWRGQQVELPPGSFACAILGAVLLVYHNPERRDTWAAGAVHPVKYRLDDEVPVEAAELEDSMARRLRARSCARLDVWLA